MRVREPADIGQTRSGHEPLERIEIEVNHVFRTFEGRPPPAHHLPKRPSNVRRGQNNITSGFNGAYELVDEADWFVNMFDHLNGDRAVKQCVPRKLLNASYEDLRTGFAGADGAILRIFGPGAPLKIRPGFIQQKPVATTYFQKIAPRQTASFEIAQKAFKGRAQSRLLVRIAGVRIP
ncbi:MAG: hypothetical protein QOF80_2130 [Verrucomicrobiota bacterium]